MFKPRYLNGFLSSQPRKILLSLSIISPRKACVCVLPNRKSSTWESTSTMSGDQAERTLFFGNVDYNASEDDIHNAFGKFGTVSDVKIIKDRDTGNSRGFGFVEMGSKGEADSLVGESGIEINGRQVIVKPRIEGDGAPSNMGDRTEKTLFVGNVDYNASEDDIRNAFGKFGTVSDVKMIKDPDTGNSRGYGFVEMGSKGEAYSVLLGESGIEINGRQVDVKTSKSEAKAKPQNYEMGDKAEKTLFVGNVDFNASEDDIYNAFGKFGTVSDVKMIKDPSTGNPRGFGFVEMGSKGEAYSVLVGESGIEINGRQVDVKTSKSSSGGGGNRSYGGGGY